jgi:hypothetical protein
MEVLEDDQNFLSDILGEADSGACLDDLDIGLTQDTQTHEEQPAVSGGKKTGISQEEKEFLLERR